MQIGRQRAHAGTGLDGTHKRGIVRFAINQRNGNRRDVSFVLDRFALYQSDLFETLGQYRKVGLVLARRSEYIFLRCRSIIPHVNDIVVIVTGEIEEKPARIAEVPMINVPDARY